MSRTEEFIKNHTNNQANISIKISNDGEIQSNCIPWVTSEQARKAVEIARGEMIDKAIGWIEEFNNHHHIMRYSDSCEPPISELTEWFKNYMKEG